MCVWTSWLPRVWSVVTVTDWNTLIDLVKIWLIWLIEILWLIWQKFDWFDWLKYFDWFGKDKISSRRQKIELTSEPSEHSPPKEHIRKLGRWKIVCLIVWVQIWILVIWNLRKGIYHVGIQLILFSAPIFKWCSCLRGKRINLNFCIFIGAPPACPVFILLSSLPVLFILSPHHTWYGKQVNFISHIRISHI